MVDVSAPTGQGVDALLDSVMLVADTYLAEDLVANPKKPAVAAVLEAHLDQGRGPVVSRNDGGGYSRGHSGRSPGEG